MKNHLQKPESVAMFLATLLLFSPPLGSAHAASIGATVTQSPSGAEGSTAINLTTEGALDWGIWATANTVNLSDSMLGGAGYTSLSFITGATQNTAAFGNPENGYTWTNGTTVPTQTVGVTNAARSTFTSANGGVRLTVNVANAGTYTLKFHTTTSGSTGNAIAISGKASLTNGAVNSTAAGASFDTLTQSLWAVNFTTDGADTLTLDVFKTSGASTIFAYEAFTLRSTVSAPVLQVASSASYSSVSSPSSFQLPFSNTGGAPLVVTSVTPGGADAAFFTINSFTSPVASNGAGSIDFTFNPTNGYRDYSASFTLASNDPSSPSSVVNITARWSRLGKLICIGDSITEARSTRPAGDGNWSWRYPFWKKLVDSNVSHEFVGTRTSNNSGSSVYPDYNGFTFPNRHEAIWGTTALERNSSAPTYLGTLKAQGKTPDTAVIFCGTNDANSTNATTVRDRIKGIVDQLQGDVGSNGNPKIRILLVSIIPRFTGSPDYTIPSANNTTIYPETNNLMKQLAVTETTGTSNVSYLDIFPLFSSNTPMILWDGTHPNGAGEQIIGDAIFGVLVPDSDQDGLTDAWERKYYPTLLSINTNSDTDQDGIRAIDEYVFGSSPIAANLPPLLQLDGVADQLRFTLPVAAGLGYEGQTRRYTVQSSTTLQGWSNGASGSATGGEISVPFSRVEPRIFFRLNVDVAP